MAYRDAIDHALGRLTPDLRMAVTLRDIEGLEYREIAEVLNVPIGTVMSRISRGREKLRPILAEALGWTDGAQRPGPDVGSRSMLTCETAEALIAREVDGPLGDEEAVALDAHAETCDACRGLRRASLDVARALALRIDAPVPAGFAARVTTRVFPGESVGWIDAINWRRWTEWMLPVAAALLMVAIVAGNRGSTATTATTGDTEVTSSESTAAAADVWALSGEGDAATALSALSARREQRGRAGDDAGDVGCGDGGKERWTINGRLPGSAPSSSWCC